MNTAVFADVSYFHNAAFGVNTFHEVNYMGSGAGLVLVHFPRLAQSHVMSEAQFWLDYEPAPMAQQEIN